MPSMSLKMKQNVFIFFILAAIIPGASWQYDEFLQDFLDEIDDKIRVKKHEGLAKLMSSIHKNYQKDLHVMILHQLNNLSSSLWQNIFMNYLDQWEISENTLKEKSKGK